MIIIFPLVPGAVKAEAAPLAVCAGLNDPQDEDGVQLQSTPAFELSFVTFAAVDAVAPGLMLAGGGVANVTAIDPEPLLEFEFEFEPTAPHPEKLNAKRKSVTSAMNVSPRLLRVLSTGSPSGMNFGTRCNGPFRLKTSNPNVKDGAKCDRGQSREILTN